MIIGLQNQKLYLGTLIDQNMPQITLQQAKRLMGVLSALPLAVAVNDNLISVSFIRDNAMDPALQKGDLVILDKWSIRQARFQRGDVVEFVNPQDSREKLVRRLAGMPMDWVHSEGTGYKWLMEGRCWLKSDNRPGRNGEKDSKLFDQVPLGLLTGRAVFVVFPFSRMHPVLSKTQSLDGQSQIRD